MRVLGIETSCDDTAIGIVTYRGGKFTIESQVTASQVLIHRKYGGVVPEIAAREHTLTILPTIASAMKQARVGWEKIDAIAVTAGPGLNTALLVGVETARNLAHVLKKPLVAVNHIEGHVCSSWASLNVKKIQYPALALIVSGGHTELILIKKFGQYKLIGRTLDDAAGEAFDKVAKLLGLSYPGGPEISKRAVLGNPTAFKFPRSIMGRDNLNFSYAGLKTSVLYEFQKHPSVSKKLVNDICASFQAAAIEPLIIKTRLAAKKTGAKTIFLGGGVAANQLLRQQMGQMVAKELPGVEYVQPVLSLCADNGVMIAVAGCFRALKKYFADWRTIDANPNWELVCPAPH